MVADTDLIRQGHADYLGDNRWQVNGRTYVMEGNGTMFPKRGEGIVSLSRGEYKALKTVVRYTGDETSVRRELHRSPDVSEADILIALDLYQLRSRKP